MLLGDVQKDLSINIPFPVQTILGLGLEIPSNTATGYSIIQLALPRLPNRLRIQHTPTTLS